MVEKNELIQLQGVQLLSFRIPAVFDERTAKPASLS